MGTRGPQRTPTKILKLHGSTLVPGREGKEPKPREAKPKTDVAITPAERKVYNRACTLVKEMGLQAETDGNALARYAKCLRRYNEVSAFLKEHGEAYPIHHTDRHGNKKLIGMKRFPQSVIRNELEQTLLRLEREFGLTPSARASLDVEASPAPRMRRVR